LFAFIQNFQQGVGVIAVTLSEAVGVRWVGSSSIFVLITHYCCCYCCYHRLYCTLSLFYFL